MGNKLERGLMIAAGCAIMIILGSVMYFVAGVLTLVRAVW